MVWHPYWSFTSGTAAPQQQIQAGGSGYPVIIRERPRKRKKVLQEQVQEWVRESAEILYGQLLESPVAEEAAKIVRPYVSGQGKNRPVPPVSAVNWPKLKEDVHYVQMLFVLWQENIARDEEDAILMLMREIQCQSINTFAAVANTLSEFCLSLKAELLKRANAEKPRKRSS